MTLELHGFECQRAELMQDFRAFSERLTRQDAIDLDRLANRTYLLYKHILLAFQPVMEAKDRLQEEVARLTEENAQLMEDRDADYAEIDRLTARCETLGARGRYKGPRV